MQEALFYEKTEDGRTLCRLCPKFCNIKPGHTGFCRVRRNEYGILYTANYGECSSYAMDPIEKKPLYHFHPGSYIFSLGTVGCNLRCGFCQNWEIAHGDPNTLHLSPSQAVELVKSQEIDGYRSVGLAYTYSEPFMWYEFVYDTARLAREAGLKNVMVTNGYVSEDPLKQILPYIDAMNIDVKGFTDEYYKSTCVGRLEPVIRTVQMSHRDCHVELTTLLIPGLNDSPEEIRQLARWVAGLDPDIPLHLSRYFPNYKMDKDPTPLETLKNAREIAREYLNYVYIGNAPQLDGSNTECPECGEMIIQRTGYYTRAVGLGEGNKCKQCGYVIKIVG